jgi:hypothetical protein
MGNQMKLILENFGKPKDEKVKIRSEKKSKNKWLFKAYHNEADYRLNKHYFEKVFNDFNEMKTFSAKHSYESKNPNYVSMYNKI